MSLMATVFNDAIARVGDNYANKVETRTSEYGAFKAIKEDTALTLDTSIIENAKKSSRMGVKIPVINRKSATDVDADSCAMPTNLNVSAFSTVSFAKYGFPVKIVPEVYGDNYIGMQEDFQRQLLDGFRKVYERLDTAAVTYLEAQKHALTSVTSNNFTVASGALDLTGGIAGISSFYGKVDGAMRKMDMNFNGLYKEVVSTEALTSNLLTQTLGGNQATNFAGLTNGTLPGSSKFQTYSSNRVTLGTNKEVRYVFSEGSFGALNWLDPKAQSNARISENEYWTTLQDPLFGINFMVHYMKKCEDASANYSWLGTTIGEGSYVIADIGFVTPYSSTAGIRPNVKFTVN